MTPEQRRETWLSEVVAGLWSRWYESGRLEPLDGAALPDDYRGWTRGLGVFVVKVPLTRARVRWLIEQIEHEYGSEPWP